MTVSNFWKKFLSILLKSLIIICGLFFIIPNIFNKREKTAFSAKDRIENAKNHFHIEEIGDSVVVCASDYYRRGSFHQFFYGEKYRKLWSQPIKVPVFKMDTVKTGLTPLQLSGGMQTIGLDLINHEGRKFDMRSVDKDQSKALHKWLRLTYFRSMFRDQAAAMNPYASLVIPTLAEAVGIKHTSPQLYFVPYDPEMDSVYRYAMAGRMVVLEKNLNDSWAGFEQYEKVTGFYDTEEMLQKAESSNIGIDTLFYLKNRLFDILINDWDRHEGQWEWALVEENDSLYFRSYPKDRDMAFYDFRGGVVNSFVLLFNNKFQSFTEDYKDVAALGKNSRELDQKLLSTVPKSKFLQLAKELKSDLNDQVINSAFMNYPAEIYGIIGMEHVETLRSRRNKLEIAALEFHASLH